MEKQKRDTFVENHCWEILVAIVFILVLLLVIYGLCPHIFKRTIDFANKQKLWGTLLGNFSVITLGIWIWLWRHKKILKDKYFSEYLGYILQYFSIKKGEIDSRKGKNKLYQKLEKERKKNQSYKLLPEEKLSLEIEEKRLTEFDNIRLQNEGRMYTRAALLERLGDNQHENIKREYLCFNGIYKIFSKLDVKKTPTGIYQSQTEEINKQLEKSRNKVLKLAGLEAEE